MDEVPQQQTMHSQPPLSKVLFAALDALFSELKRTEEQGASPQELAALEAQFLALTRRYGEVVDAEAAGTLPLQDLAAPQRTLPQTSQVGSSATEKPVIEPLVVPEPFPARKGGGWELITSPTRLAEIIPLLQQEPVLALDTETTGLNPYSSKIRLLQIGAPKQIYLLDCFALHPGLELMYPLLSNGPVKILHNAKFDWKMVAHHFQIKIAPLFDTMLADQVLSNGRNVRHRLGDLAQRYLGEEIDKSLGTSDWSGLLSQAQLNYAATDVRVLLALYERLKRELVLQKLEEVAELEFAVVPVLSSIELAGVYVDAEQCRALASAWLHEQRNIETKLQAALAYNRRQTLFGEEVTVPHLRSPEQMKAALAEQGFVLDSLSDEGLRGINAPFIPDLLRWRELEKLRSTFGTIGEKINPLTGRIHADFAQCVTASGRFACSNPNVQQIPRSYEVRACFSAPPGRSLIVADYSQIELRIVAAMSGDTRMNTAYRNGEDLHRITATLITGKVAGDITKEDRQLAKPVNFGLIYAMGARGLAAYARNNYGVQMSEAEATRIRAEFFKGYKGITAWQSRLRSLGERERRCFTLSGRVRYYEGEPTTMELYNTPVQGTAADGLKAALVLLYERLGKAPGNPAIVNMIHDEIVVEVATEHAETVCTLVREAMITGMMRFVPAVPIEVEAHVCANWAEK